MAKPENLCKAMQLLLQLKKVQILDFLLVFWFIGPVLVYLSQVRLLMAMSQLYVKM